MSAIRWGILGPGRIARQFAAAFRAVPDAELVAVAGRDADRAADFAAAFGVPRAYGDAAMLVDDPDVDAVYVATPHHAHAAWTRRCLLAGKAVLCEKPLTVNAAQAAELLRLAHARGVFLMEAMWTRLHPAWQQVRRWLRQGAVGDVRVLTSSFGAVFDGGPHDRWLDPAQAGGALLDIGIYHLSLSQWVMEREPEHFDVTARHASTGVDSVVSATLHYAGGAMSHSVCSFEADLANDFHVDGSAGSIHVDAPFWCTPRVTLRRGGVETVLDTPHAVNGYEHEIRAAVSCLRGGQLECAEVPHADTLATMRLMDAMRGCMGVRYPFEDA